MNEGTGPGMPPPNEHQARYILSTCEYIDRLLTDIEGVLNASASKSVFPRYSSDLTPVQRQTIEDFVACLRTRLVRILDDQGIGHPSGGNGQKITALSGSILRIGLLLVALLLRQESQLHISPCFGLLHIPSRSDTACSHNALSSIALIETTWADSVRCVYRRHTWILLF